MQPVAPPRMLPNQPACPEPKLLSRRRVTNSRSMESPKIVAARPLRLCSGVNQIIPLNLAVGWRWDGRDSLGPGCAGPHAGARY